MARHQLGRLIAYATLGAVAGGGGAAVVSALAPDWVSVILGVVLAIGMLATAIRLVRRPRSARLTVLGRKPRTPLAARVIGRLPREPMLIGALSAMLPCGALYSALLIAASAGSSAAGAATMTSFAFASGVGLLAAGWITKRATSELGRRSIAALLVVGALIVIARPVAQALSPDASPSCHAAR